MDDTAKIEAIARAISPLAWDCTGNEWYEISRMDSLRKANDALNALKVLEQAENG